MVVSWYYGIKIWRVRSKFLKQWAQQLYHRRLLLQHQFQAIKSSSWSTIILFFKTPAALHQDNGQVIKNINKRLNSSILQWICTRYPSTARCFLLRNTLHDTSEYSKKHLSLTMQYSKAGAFIWNFLTIWWFWSQSLRPFSTGPTCCKTESFSVQPNLSDFLSMDVLFMEQLETLICK